MKKNDFLWGLLAAMLLAVPTLALTSCAGDDDEVGGGSGSTTAGVVDPKSGLRLASYNSSYDNYSYYYTNDGKLDYINEWEYSSQYPYQYDFSYNPNKITETSPDGDEIMTFEVSYNGSGYVTAMDISWDVYNDEQDAWSGSERATLSYDGSGHLVKYVSTCKESGIEDGQKFSYTEKNTGVLTWSNNQLTKAANNWETDNGDTNSAIVTFEYDGSYDNPYRQWAPSLAEYALGGFSSLLAYVGLLGVGPTELPSSCSDYSESDYTDHLKFSYTFGSEGALRYTYIDGARHSFGYDYTDSKETRTAVNIPYEPIKRQTRGRFLFQHHRKHSVHITLTKL